MQLYLQINHLLLPPFQFNGKKAPNIKILISYRVFPEVVGGRVVEVSAHHIFFYHTLKSCHQYCKEKCHADHS